MQILTAATAGNGNEVNIRADLNRWGNHIYTFYVSGTFGGTTVTLQISPVESGDNWFTVTGVSITAAGAVNCEFRACRVRAVVTGGAGMSINAWLL